MKTLDIAELLKGNDYPGRGIIIGKSADGTKAVTIDGDLNLYGGTLDIANGVLETVKLYAESTIFFNLIYSVFSFSLSLAN